MFGSHLSIAGYMLNALNEAESLGLDTVQVFTKNQQQWKAPPLDPAMSRDFVARTNQLTWQGRLVSHASYLINLASVNDELWHKSIDLMTVEIERCHELGITFLVHHPGSHVGGALETGLDRIVDAYRTLLKRTQGVNVVSCLEGTAGGGSTIGARFDDLATLRSRIAEITNTTTRVGICLDSCHLHAAGYDMSTAASARAVLNDFDSTIGLAHLRVWHLNDSKGALGSKLDRHEHIGIGYVGGGLTDGGLNETGSLKAIDPNNDTLYVAATSTTQRAKPATKPPAKSKSKSATTTTPTSTPASTFNQARLEASGFAAILAEPAFAKVPKIMETPKEDAIDGSPMDSTNLRRLKSLLPS